MNRCHPHSQANFSVSLCFETFHIVICSKSILGKIGDVKLEFINFRRAELVHRFLV